MLERKSRRFIVEPGKKVRLEWSANCDPIKDIQDYLKENNLLESFKQISPACALSTGTVYEMDKRLKSLQKQDLK